MAVILGRPITALPIKAPSTPPAPTSGSTPVYTGQGAITWPNKDLGTVRRGFRIGSSDPYFVQIPQPSAFAGGPWHFYLAAATVKGQNVAGHIHLGNWSQLEFHMSFDTSMPPGLLSVTMQVVNSFTSKTAVFTVLVI